MKDNKEWIKHNSGISQIVESESNEESEEDSIDSIVDEIQRFLKTR